MPTTGDTAVLRFGADGKWHYDFLSPGTLSVLSFGSLGATQVTQMGIVDGNIPTCKLPLSVMNLTMTPPMRATGNVVSVDLATATTAGAMSGSQCSRLDNLATVATTGAYADLLEKPTLGTASTQNTSAFATAAQGTLAASALQPGATIPWSTLSGVPTTVAGFGISDGVSTGGSYANPTWITSLAFSKITGTPTTLAGYGITNAATSAQGAKADTACQSGNGALSVTATVMSIVASSASVPGTMSAADYAKLAAYPAYAARSFANTPSRTIQTVAAQANGWQLSSSRDSHVSYSVSIGVTSTIGVAQGGYVVMEIAATNSSTAGDWTEICRVTMSQAITLALVLQSVVANGGAVIGIVPSGYYVRMRSANTSGSPTFQYLSGQEVLL